MCLSSSWTVWCLHTEWCALMFAYTSHSHQLFLQSGDVISSTRSSGMLTNSTARYLTWSAHHSKSPSKTESSRHEIFGLLKLKTAGRITAMVNSTGLQTNENKTQASQHSSHLHYGSDESFGDSGKRQGCGKKRRAKSFPQRRSTGSDARVPLQQCLEAWCLISDEMSIIRDSAGESGAEQIWWRGD